MATQTDKPRKLRAPIDWEAVERDYRIGQLTVREIQAKHGCSNGGMMDRAKREGWTRDLTQPVRIATKAKVREKLVEQYRKTEQEKAEQAEQEQKNFGAQTEQAVISDIEIAARASASVQIKQQGRVGKLAVLFEKTTSELEAVNDDPQSIAEIATMIREESPQAAEAISKLRSLTSRMNNLKTASDVLKTLHAEERKAFGLDDDSSSEKSSIDDIIERIEREDAEQ